MTNAARSIGAATKIEPARHASRYHRAPAANEPEAVAKTMSALPTVDHAGGA
jgi:hypothetical protein